MQFLALQYEATRCYQEDILAGNDDPNLPLVTCDKHHKQAYLLAPSIISGDQIDNATSWAWTSTAAATSSTCSSRAGGQHLGGLHRRPHRHADRVHAGLAGGQRAADPGSHPRRPHPDHRRRPAVHCELGEGAGQRPQYGSLPLSFESSEAQTVSATLGLTSLRAGLLAGAIGLGLVLVYSLLYYRVLGLLTALSLVASGAMVFAILVLLGRYINYTLDLAGIAGLIIGIGTTADSFVVFFERIKDEIREGKSIPVGGSRVVGRGLAGRSCRATR